MRLQTKLILLSILTLAITGNYLIATDTFYQDDQHLVSLDWIQSNSLFPIALATEGGGNCGQCASDGFKMWQDCTFSGCHDFRDCWCMLHSDKKNPQPCTCN